MEDIDDSSSSEDDVIVDEVSNPAITSGDLSSTQDLEESFEEERSLVLKAVEEAKAESLDLSKPLKWLASLLCSSSHVFYQDILPMVLDGRKFILDGEALLLMALGSESLSGYCGGQTLHAVYIVEMFLKSLVNKGLKFFIIFFKAWETCWKETSPIFSLSRHALRLHLLNNSDIKIIENVDAPWEAGFKDFIEYHRPSFIMTYTEIPPPTKNDSDFSFKLSPLSGVLIQAQVACCNSLQLDVVDITTISCGVSAIHANVYLPSPAMHGLLPKLKRNLSTILNIIPQHRNKSQKKACSSPLSTLTDLRTVVTMKAAAATLRCQSNADSMWTNIIVHIIILHTVLLSYLPLKMRCLRKSPKLPIKNVSSQIEVFQKEMVMALEEVSGEETYNFKSCADMWHGHLLGALFYSVLNLGGLHREMLEDSVADKYEELCHLLEGLTSNEETYFSIDECFKVDLVKAPQIDHSKLLLSQINRLIPSSCQLTKLVCGSIISIDEDESLLEASPVVQEFLDMVRQKKELFHEGLHWHSNTPLTDEIDRIPVRKVEVSQNPRYSQHARNNLARFYTYYGNSLEGGNSQPLVIAVSKQEAGHRKDKIKTDKKKGKSLKPSSLRHQIIEENVKRKASEELKQAEERLKAFNAVYDSLLTKGQFLKAAEKCDLELLSLFKHDSLKLHVLLQKAYAYFKQWCIVECDDYKLKNTGRNLRSVKELFVSVRDILLLSLSCNIALSAKDTKFLSRVLSNLGMSDLANLWCLPTCKEPIETKFSVQMDFIEFQLMYLGADLDRDTKGEPDSRVQSFIPDPWQTKLFDIIDNHQSAVVVAPTSSGKTYASYYCMEKVIRESNDGIVVYVCPTKALVNQVYATIYAKFKKTMPPGKTLQGIFTRDYSDNITCCQILVTVPECLEILLLSPRKYTWVKNLKYVIFDEVHCLVGQGGGLAWENALLLIRCPYLALSATISEPETFVAWLQKVEDFKLSQGYCERPRQTFRVHLVQHSERHNHLKKNVLHMDGSAEHVHPYGLLDTALLKECGGVPAHITLSPDEALQLYNSMKEKLPPDQKERLYPYNFFKSISKQGFLTMPIVRQYSDELRHCLETLPTDLQTNVLNSFKVLDIQEECSKLSVLLNITVLLDFLRQNQLLPAIVFSYSRDLVTNLPKRMLSYLESFSHDSDVSEDESRHTEVEKNKPSDKVEKRRKSTKQYTKQLKLLQGSSILDGKSSVRGAGRSNPKLVEYIEKRLVRLKLSSQNSFVRILRKGLGLHHAGMGSTERSAVEMLFRMKVLNVVCATGTLALGIHMPCKTVVIAGDSPYLNSLEYHQMSGRAGRRGFDNEGNVIFFGVNKRKMKTLMTANVPKMVGNFPVSLSLVLRLFLLVSDSTSEGKVSQETTDTVTSSCYVLLENSLLYETIPYLKSQVKHFFLFAHQFLLCQGLLDDDGHPLHASGLVTHLHYHEPGNFAFVYLLNKGILETLCKEDSKGRITYDSLINVMTVLSFLFAPLPFRKNLMARKWNSSKVILPELPHSVYMALRDYNKEVLHIFSHYFSCVSNYVENMQGDTSLPITELKLPFGNDSKTSISKCSLFSTMNDLRFENHICSTFAGLSGNTDYDLFPSEGSINNIRHDVDSSVKIVPTVILDVQYNSYALDFFRHGISAAICNENGLKSGEDFKMLKDFSLVLSCISVSLNELLSPTNRLAKAIDEINNVFSKNFTKSYYTFQGV